MKVPLTAPKTLAITYIALIALAVSTWGLAHVDLGAAWVNDVVALAIAITKTALVVAIFMELRHERKLNKLWALIAVTWLALLASIIGDYGTRHWDSLPQSWVSQERGHVAGSPAGGAPTPTPYQGREPD